MRVRVVVEPGVIHDGIGSDALHPGDFCAMAKEDSAETSMRVATARATPAVPVVSQRVLTHLKWWVALMSAGLQHPPTP